MSRVLHIDGTVRPDGVPWSEPQVEWAWDGGVRADPGEEVSYASDRGSGIQRLVQRPFSRRGSLWLPASDVGEIGAPLRELARAGVMMEGAKTQVLTGTDWDLTTWTKTWCTVTAGQRGPTGESTGDGQAYLLTPVTSLGGNIRLVVVTPTNMNVDTYVFDLWARKPAGDGPFSMLLLNPGANNFHTTIGNKWTRLQVTSLTQDSTSATIYIGPGGFTTHPNEDWSTAIVWAPGLTNAGGAAGESDMGGGSVISLGETRVLSAFNGPFPWPAVPWTLRCDFTPFYGGTDGLVHTVFQADRGATEVYQLQKTAANNLQFVVRERAGGVNTATQAVTWAHRAEQRVVVVSRSDGDVECYLNGAAFAKQLSPLEGLVAAAPDTLDFGSGSGSFPFDGVLHSFELWDRELDPARLF